MGKKRPILFNIFQDAFYFFDKHWIAIIAGALLSVGLADIVSYLLSIFVPMGAVDLRAATGSDIKIENYILVEAGAVFLAGIWFRGYIAVLVGDDGGTTTLSLSNACKTTAKLYARLLALNLVAIVITYITAAIGLLIMSANALGAVFLIPAILFSVWFSLITPVAVFDSAEGILPRLKRSRSLVSGHFMQVLFLMFIVVTPTFAMTGIGEETALFWPVLSFVNFSTSILDGLFITFAYHHLRAADAAALLTKRDAAPVSNDESA
ncbi:MAG: hypothetical protein QME41_10180 [Actinomycetota bacterium]|nr:hypothetical protein [Actinomycetota bacterium]